MSVYKCLKLQTILFEGKIMWPYIKIEKYKKNKNNLLYLVNNFKNDSAAMS